MYIVPKLDSLQRMHKVDKNQEQLSRILIFLKNKDYKKWKILRTKTIKYQRNFKEPN